jgi:hypothetical protein
MVTEIGNFYRLNVKKMLYSHNVVIFVYGLAMNKLK